MRIEQSRQRAEVALDDGQVTIVPESEVTYTLTVTNLGVETATGVSLQRGVNSGDVPACR